VFLSRWKALWPRSTASEAAKLGARLDPGLARLHAKELEQGNRNEA
jgi:hypothetical protein